MVVSFNNKIGIQLTNVQWWFKLLVKILSKGRSMLLIYYNWWIYDNFMVLYSIIVVDVGIL
ncbi:hypothetical protein [Candidatus Hodgkinia cicadicola]|uniref:hypothetical protein n=1 Tax=Candidatus Hodgkinia cicadicola TaxID=573658 RepID=UPI0011BAC1F3